MDLAQAELSQIKAHCGETCEQYLDLSKVIDINHKVLAMIEESIEAHRKIDPEMSAAARKFEGKPEEKPEEEKS